MVGSLHHHASVVGAEEHLAASTRGQAGNKINNNGEDPAAWTDGSGPSPGIGH